MVGSAEDAAVIHNGSHIENAVVDGTVQLERNELPSLSPFDSSSKRSRRPVDRCMYIQPEPTKRKIRACKTKKAEAEFETVWICAECKEAECMMEPEATELLICDGPCRRLFHYPCAGLVKLPSEDEEFICTDCKERKHMCSMCSNYGTDDGDVFKCSKNNCGLFFHESCLAMQNIEVEIVEEVEARISVEISASNGDVASPAVKRRFVCPAHSCWTCTQKELKEQERATNADAGAETKSKSSSGKKKAMKLSGAFECKAEKFMTRCLECPIAYHVSCIPPTARFHELATLCHEHAGTCKLPELDPNVSIQERIERAIDEKFDGFVDRRERRVQNARTSGENLFFPGVSGGAPTTSDSELLNALHRSGELADISAAATDRLWFCLPCDLKDEVHSKPPNYRHVHSLQYYPVKKPPRIPHTGDICQCVDRCGEGCINRMLYTECFGDAAKTKHGNSSNCSVGPNCGNRQLGQRSAAKCKPRREQGKGWGLCVVNKATKGDLVQEYVGEVVDAVTKEQRLIEWSQEHPNDANFYLMELQPGWFIDARLVANLSRFVNHSCEPNCRLLQINVNGRMRCGIFALRNIDEGEFLSYDYHFDTKHGDRFICCCGSLMCRGTMKGGSSQLNVTSPSKKSKSELWESAKAGYDRDKKFLAEFHDDRGKRSTQVGDLVPGADVGAKDEVVANGAQVKYRDNVRSNRIFLWRNVVQGCDFATRFGNFGSETP